MMSESRVGSKGELFPPKEMRERLGLKPNRKVLYRVENGRLVVEPIPTLEELFARPHEVEVDLDEFHGFRRDLSKKAER